VTFHSSKKNKYLSFGYLVEIRVSLKYLLQCK